MTDDHEPTGQETLDGAMGNPAASGTWSPKPSHDQGATPAEGTEHPTSSPAPEGALKDKERRNKALLLVAIGLALIVYFALSSIIRHRSTTARATAPDAFSHTPPPQTKAPALPFWAQSPPKSTAPPGGPGTTGAGGAGEDPELAALHRQAAVLQALAAVRQAQYQVANLRINPAQKGGDEPLSVTFAPSAASPPRDTAPSSRDDAATTLQKADTYAAVTDTDAADGGRQTVIRAGTLLDAVLINRLVTDNYTSPVICLVDRAYYDPATRRLLIPAGTKILGKAEAVKYQTASRLAITFNTFQFPNGRTFTIKPDEQALEGLGIFGLKDSVNRHTARILFTAGLIGILTGWNTSQTNTNSYGQMSGNDQLRLQASASLSHTGEQMLSPFLNAVPTITVDEGHRLKIFISRDLPIDTYAEASYE